MPKAYVKFPSLRPVACHLCAAIAMLLLSAAQARAMNQEGHDDDWIVNFVPALLLMQEAGNARPLPSRNCPVSATMLLDNPYEQIQLHRHRCPAKLDSSFQPPG